MNAPKTPPAAAGSPSAAPFCDQCGEPGDTGAHDACARRRDLEPPRYCADCRRRMVVQVTPRGWTAKCVEHGVRTS